MSLMKRYAEESGELVFRAMTAAWMETPKLRMDALREVFEDCGTTAQAYADPAAVTRFLVKAVTKEFLYQRRTTTYREAV
ncbi:hypothetical protein [Streptomyces ardesiacus]|uniref:hypothetical protein n=1 Tax=Streptomyces ardesiacus TaxID=285564 RepID=UPI00364B9D4D